MSREQTLPMCRADYLLSHLAQEASEVAIRCTKAQMFGLDDIQPGQEFTNRDRIMHACIDLLAMLEVAGEEGVLPGIVLRNLIDAKKEKAAHFANYSRKLGRLERI